jgi:hypothetical protein
MDDDEWPYFPVIQGFGSAHDLRDAPTDDPRNPRLAGFKSVSYAGAVGLAKSAPKTNAPRKAGFVQRRIK